MPHLASLQTGSMQESLGELRAAAQHLISCHDRFLI
jgi:hypothetical protein